jgi:CRISPR-associated protein Cst1
MKITLGNWLYNAGILGFLRILEKSGQDVSKLFKNQYIDITPNLLQDFEKAYFGFVMKEMIYPHALGFENKYSQKGLIELLRKENVDITSIETKYENKLKDTASTKLEILELYDTLEKCVKEYFSELENTVNQLPDNLPNEKKDKKNSKETSRSEALKILKDAKKKKEKLLESVKNGNQFVVLLQNFYKNKSIIGNPSITKGKTRIDAFKKEYIEPVQELLKQSNNINAPRCRFCHQLPAATNKKEWVVFDETLFSPIGVSSSTFTNFFYKNNPDMFICKLCELILLCSFAGFNRKPYQIERDSETSYLFVNLPDLQELWRVNNVVKQRYLLWSESQDESIYDTIFRDILLQEQREKSLWVLQNILFIEIRPEPNKAQTKPRFLYFAFGKDLAKLFRDSYAWKLLRKIPNRIIDKKAPKGQQNLWLKNDSVKQLLENSSLYPLCFKVVRTILNNENSFGIESCFSLSFIQCLLKQIQNFLKNGGDKTMDSKTVYGILQSFYQNGKDFEEIDIEKRRRYAFKLLSLIRGRQYNEFCNNILQLYLTIKKAPTGKNLISLLNQEDVIDFEAKAYAFMSGFLSETKGQKIEETSDVSEEEQEEVSS